MHLLNGVAFADVMPVGEFLDVSIKVLRRHLVIRALMPSLEHRPKGFHAIGVGLAPDIFGDRMLDGFVIRQALIGAGIVRVDSRAGLRVFANEAVKRGAVGMLNNLRRYALGLAILCSHNLPSFQQARVPQVPCA